MAKKKVVKKSTVKAAAAKKTSATKKSGPKAKAAPKKKAVAKAAPKKKAAAKPAVKTKTVAKTPAKKVPAKKTAPKKAVAVKAAPAKKSPAKAPARTTAKAATAVVKDAARILAESVVEGMLEKKAANITWLDLRNIENAVCDYFIICEGSSNTQVEAIADSVETVVKKQLGQRPMRSEGWENALWILIDYFDVVVHVFEHDTRQFYNLESLWADAEIIPVKQ